MRQVVKHILSCWLVSVALSLIPHSKIITMLAPSKQKLLIAIFSILLCGTAFKAKAGLDSYEIYLNDKLILKQYVNQPLKLESLNLTQSHMNDKLVIYYSQCNVPGKIGKGRTIAVKDARGNTLKLWKFADAEGRATGMKIAVKELLALEKKTAGSELTLFYAAEGRQEGQLLANFHIGNKGTAYHQKHEIASELILWASFPFIQSFCL